MTGPGQQSMSQDIPGSSIIYFGAFQTDFLRNLPRAVFDPQLLFKIDENHPRLVIKLNRNIFLIFQIIL